MKLTWNLVAKENESQGRLWGWATRERESSGGSQRWTPLCSGPCRVHLNCGHLYLNLPKYNVTLLLLHTQAQHTQEHCSKSNIGCDSAIAVYWYTVWFPQGCVSNGESINALCNNNISLWSTQTCYPISFGVHLVFSFHSFLSQTQVLSASSLTCQVL